MVQYPPRGYIYDRNGRLLVSNQPAYNLCVTYNLLQPFDTLELCTLLRIDPESLRVQLDKFNQVIRLRRHSRYQPYAIVSQISPQDYPRIQERLYKYPGFSIEKTTMRHYEYPSAANVFGFLSEIGPDADLGQDSPYKIGDIIGATGVERMYEKQLRGIPGHRYVQVDVTGKVTDRYMDGKFDSPAVAGKDITLGLDIDLQRYGEALMQGKRGCIIAIEPSTGQILAMVTAPSYDPALLSGRGRSRNYAELSSDPSQPMFDRGLIAEYAPGSPWKIVTGLAGLSSGAVDPSFSVYCGGGYRVGNHVMRCVGGVGQTLDMYRGYQYSCNTYFATVYARTLEHFPTPAQGLDFWHRTATALGSGKYLGTDLSTGRKGYVPDAQFYDRLYGRGRWKASTTISNAIGQGEITVTPMHLANLAAVVANRGYYYRPHIIRSIDGQAIDTAYTQRIETGIAREHFDVVARGMANVFREGTAREYAIPQAQFCGKTGTVENFVRIDGRLVQLPDHGMFVAFGPEENPKIAITVVVENGRFGRIWAAPIASADDGAVLAGGPTARSWKNGSWKVRWKRCIASATFCANRQKRRRSRMRIGGTEADTRMRDRWALVVFLRRVRRDGDPEYLLGYVRPAAPFAVRPFPVRGQAVAFCCHERGDRGGRVVTRYERVRADGVAVLYLFRSLLLGLPVLGSRSRETGRGTIWASSRSSFGNCQVCHGIGLVFVSVLVQRVDVPFALPGDRGGDHPAADGTGRVAGCGFGSGVSFLFPGVVHGGSTRDIFRGGDSFGHDLHCRCIPGILPGESGVCLCGGRWCSAVDGGIPFVAASGRRRTVGGCDGLGTGDILHAALCGVGTRVQGIPAAADPHVVQTGGRLQGRGIQYLPERDRHRFGRFYGKGLPDGHPDQGQFRAGTVPTLSFRPWARSGVFSVRQAWWCCTRCF